MSTVLVGFDFSTGSAYAVDLAIDIANRMQMDLMLVVQRLNAAMQAWPICSTESKWIM